jgi:hypothetical protein
LGRHPSILVELFSSLHHQCTAWILSAPPAHSLRILENVIGIYINNRAGIVRRGNFVVACARSHMMAMRIANALNQYTPNEIGD